VFKLLTKKAEEKSHVKFREESAKCLEQRQQDQPDEAALGRGFGHFVPVHERGHWKPFEFLRVTLLEELLISHKTTVSKTHFGILACFKCKLDLPG